jgi:tetratricopeptide (TPR) repeat protein
MTNRRSTMTSWAMFYPVAATIPVAIALASFIAGCAEFRKPETVVTDVLPQKSKRRQDILQDFEKTRDRAQYQAALNFLQQGNAKACRQSLEQLLARTPTHHDGRLLMAELLLEEQNFDAAAKQAREILQAQPDDAQAEHVLATILDAAGKPAEARAHFDRAAKLDPNNETFRLSCQLAAGAALGGPAPAAAAQVKASSTAVKQGSPSQKSRAPVKDASLQAAGYATASDSAHSGDSHDTADSLESAHVEETFYRLEAALSTSKLVEARAAVEDLMDMAPDNPQIRLRAAVIALRHRRPELAAEIAKEATIRFPKSPEAYRLLGTAVYRQGRYAEAQSAFQAALSLDNTAALSYFLMGCTLQKLNQTDAAASHFARAAELDARFQGNANTP